MRLSVGHPGLSVLYLRKLLEIDRDFLTHKARRNDWLRSYLGASVPPSPVRLSMAVTVHLTSKVFAFVVLGLLFIAVTPATAASPADDLIKQGLELRRAGRDTDALAKFESAYSLTKAPRAAAQWGLCLQAVSRWSEADPLLAEALSSAQDPWVKKNRNTLKESLEIVKAHVGRVEVLGDPVGAKVAIAGRIVGTFPLPAAITVNEGVVDVEVSADGYDPAIRTVTLTGSSYQRLVVRLKRSASVATAPLPVASADPASVPDSSLAITSSPATFDEPRPITKNPWFWGGIGVVVVGAIVAVALASGGDKYPSANEVRSVP